MATLKVKVRDFLELDNISGDIYDDYDDSLGIGYDSGMALTEVGQEYFKDILDFEIEIKPSGTFIALVSHVYDNWEQPEEFEELINAFGDVAHPIHWKFYELFEGLAGHVSTEKYDTWFKEREGA